MRRPHGVLVEILSGRVTLEGGPVALSARELQLVVALSLRGPVPAERLVEDLWPNAEGDDAKGALKVYVHRVRRRLGRDFITRERGMYRLSSRARIDVAEIASRLSCGCDAVNAWTAETELFLELARRLRTVRTPNSESWAWFSPHAERLAGVGREFALAVVRATLGRKEVAAAKSVLRELIAEDRCDEEARELMIRAHVLSGERGAAAYEYRLYAGALRAELGLTPSAELRRLFEAERVS